MKQIVVISGKGGTGKTVITASFAALAKKKAMADCDVDAADLHLLLHPRILEKYKFKGNKKAFIDPEKCNRCGKCVEVCRFDAVLETAQGDIKIDPISCEGCGICELVCPTEAISMEENFSGEWFISETRYGPMVHAKLGVAEENSGKLVTLVRQNARVVAEKNSLDLVLVDGPPGIGCPVIASLSGVDIALVVTEPTLSGIHDLERVIGVANHFGVKSACVINKYDINLDNTRKIERWCQIEEVPVLSKIPYDHRVSEALVKGIPLVEYSDCPAAREIKNLWNLLEQTVELKV